MARSHARLLAAVWVDDDFTARSVAAQRAYFMLLSQPKLSIVGTLDYFPSRWALLANDSETDDIEQAVKELEHHRFIVVDRGTDELLIRTIVKHDLTPARLNVNLVKGVWSAWTAVASPQLRSVIVHNLPEEVWANAKVVPPASAVQMRRSRPLERAVATGCPDDPSEPPVSTISLVPPSLPPRCSDDPLPAELWTLYASRALRDQQRKGTVRNQVAWLAATTTRARNEETERAEQLWRDYDVTATQLVDVLLSPSPPQWLNTCRRPA